jgi:hypothetical protein
MWPTSELVRSSRSATSRSWPDTTRFAALDGDRSLDRRVVVVVLQHEVLELVVVDAGVLTFDAQPRQRVRLSGELFLYLLVVVVVDVRVTACPDEVTHFQAALLSDHVRQQSVAGDVKRHAEEHVRASLVQLARQLVVRHVELEQHVTWRQGHVRNLLHVPRRDDQSPRIRVTHDGVDDAGQLIDRFTGRCRPRPPLNAVNRTKVTVFVRPFVPDLHSVLVQPANVGIPLKEPQQFVCDRLEVNPLGGDEGETLGQIVTDLPAEHAGGAGTGAIFLVRSVLQNVTKEIFVRCYECQMYLLRTRRTECTPPPFIVPNLNALIHSKYNSILVMLAKICIHVVLCASEDAITPKKRPLNKKFTTYKGQNDGIPGRITPSY